MPLPHGDDSHDVRVAIEATDDGRRLDVVIASHVVGASRATAQRWIRAGLVTVNGRPAKASQPVATGSVATVRIPATEPSHIGAESLPIQVLFEDADIAVVDKPAGMVVHPAAGHSSGTLVNALLGRLSRLSGIGGEARPGIVHRLDKGTSGVMVVAKHDEAHRSLAAQFHDRTVQKKYVALVWGQPTAGVRLNAPIGRDPHNRKKFTSRANRSRSASTDIESVQPLGEVSLVSLRIGTGRTHQIRVHLAESGFPVVGDETYGGVRAQLPAGLAAIGRLKRPFLHAAELAFHHPRDGRLVTVAAPLPAELEELVGALSRRASRPYCQSPGAES